MAEKTWCCMERGQAEGQGSGWGRGSWRKGRKDEDLAPDRGTGMEEETEGYL